MVNPIKNFIRSINFIKYRFRYLFNYILIGFISIIIEILVVRYVLLFPIDLVYKVVVGFIFGMLIAYFLNAKINFKVPKDKNLRAFTAFLIISTFAFGINLILIKILRYQFVMQYSYLRLMTSSFIFILSYAAHRKITFDFVKYVGVAIYLNKGENISEIYSRIKYYADFIHLDLVDKTFNENSTEVDLLLMDKISKTWGVKKFLHIMSKKPSIWIEKLKGSVDVILFHLDIEEPIDDIILLCKKNNKKVGLVVYQNSDKEKIIPYLSKIDFVQIMGISNLGEKGQPFNRISLDNLNFFNKLRKKMNFEIIFDGGVKPTNIGRIDAKYIVSSSGILSSKNPITSFMELKTSSRYRNIDSELRKEILFNIEKIIKKSEFIISGNVVGSFSESKGLKGVNDIDIVIILNKFTKEKFNQVLFEFVQLKEMLESKYGFEIFINSTLGPLKFNEKNIVFHLMLYDLESHKKHTLNSPFTCYDWQRTKLSFKTSLSKLSPVNGLMPNNFFNSRRGVKEYLSELKENKISYREYSFNNNSIVEEKKYKNMNKRDKIEFSYHILKFLITNFLKLYSRQNSKIEFKRALKKYLEIFPKNKKTHLKYIKRILKIKEKRKFDEHSWLIEYLEFFMKDFEEQFQSYFYKNSKEITFIRHQETELNKKQLFVGQKLDPDIIPIPKQKIICIKEKSNKSDYFFSSPSIRCKNTLKKITDKKIIVDKRLNEIDYGDIEGAHISSLKTTRPEILSAWNNLLDPNFPDGENTKDVFLRANSFLSNLKIVKTKNIFICTHNVLLRTIIGRYLGIPIQDWHKITIPHLEPIKLILTQDNRFFIDLEPHQIEEIFKNF